MTPPDILAFSLKIVERGVFMATPVFDGATSEELDILTEEAYGTKKNQVRLRDGQTGEYFDQPITVGYKNMLKLHHLVVDKINARSTGSYNVITQQPLGGKSQGGGQRFGEMEFWALQAHGAAFSIMENSTIKSDDYHGRQKLLHDIISNNFDFTYRTPASFSVLLQELRGLCLNLQWLQFTTEQNTQRISSFVMSREEGRSAATIPPRNLYEEMSFDDTDHYVTTRRS
jgi:DNA-directed RNA polymerase subunit beta